MILETLQRIDADLTARIRIAEKPGILRSVARFIGHTGDSWFWFGGLIVVYLLGDSSWQLWALKLFISILSTAMLVLLLKFTFRRSRPAGEWGQIYRKTDPHSFPSGHAARGMLIGVLAFGLGPAWLGWPLLIWGPIVGLARVATGLHYLSDIAAGWVLGGVIALAALQVFAGIV